MALIFHKAATPTKSTKSGDFDYRSWYQANKARLSEKRARRYREDPEYRQAAINRSHAQRKTIEDPTALTHVVSFAEAAEKLGVTMWTLREWRKKNYFPEPVHRMGRLWFNDSQVSLLGSVAAFCQTHSARAGTAEQSELDSVVSLVYANWNQ